MWRPLSRAAPRTGLWRRVFAHRGPGRPRYSAVQAAYPLADVGHLVASDAMGPWRRCRGDHILGARIEADFLAAMGPRRRRRGDRACRERTRSRRSRRNGATRRRRGAIQPLVPRIETVVDQLVFTEEAAAELRASGGPLGARIAAAIEGSQSGSLRSAGGTYKVFLLSAPESGATVRLDGPIVSDTIGRGGKSFAWTMGRATRVWPGSRQGRPGRASCENEVGREGASSLSERVQSAQYRDSQRHGGKPLRERCIGVRDPHPHRRVSIKKPDGALMETVRRSPSAPHGP